MSHRPALWRCLVLLLTVFNQHLLPADCMRLIPLGYLTVDPAPPVRLGSNVTVVCHITSGQKQDWLDISLEVNWKTVDSWTRVNRTARLFRLPKLSAPESVLVCRLRFDELSQIVTGLLLRAGLPPDKPGNVSCETTRSSAAIDCLWMTGRDAYIKTFYNITISSENGTQVHHLHQNDKNVTIPKSMLDENTKYLLSITAYNHFGVSHSDAFILSIRDAVIPETPVITGVDFENDSAEATLRWETSESSADLKPFARLRTDNVSWAAVEGTEVREGQIRLDDLRLLTEYEFQIRACVVPQSNTSIRSLCSKWSRSMKRTSPGKGPSQQLDVWRTLGAQDKDGMQTVSILWRPPPPEDYSGALQQFRILWATDHQHEVSCSAAVTQWSGQVPKGVHTLTVSAVNAYGASPPAEVRLRHSDIAGPVLRDSVPAPNGSAVLVSWSQFRDTVDRQLLYYVLEWKRSLAGRLQWKKPARDQTNSSVTGLTAGVRYNVSLYAVTTRGLSAPSSRFIYSSEMAPASGPNISVLTHETKRILVEWDELPVEQRRGSVTEYTIYLHTVEDGAERKVTVPASGPRQTWLDCPEGALTLRMSASTSAGEGPPGRQISSQCDAPAIDLVIVAVFTVTVFIAVIANLMCWSCVRKRVKQACLFLGPNWLVENLPKADHSNAIKLLESEWSEPLFSTVHSDPPLSPITVVPRLDRNEVYPTVCVEGSQMGPLGGTTSLTSDTSCGYKPQILTLLCERQEVKDAEEKQGDAQGEPDRAFLFDFSASPPPLTCSAVTTLSWPAAETCLFRGSMLRETKGAEDGVKAHLFSQDPKEDDITAPDTTDTCWSECTSEITLNGGYFPQMVAPQPDNCR